MAKWGKLKMAKATKATIRVKKPKKAKIGQGPSTEFLRYTVVEEDGYCDGNLSTSPADAMIVKVCGVVYAAAITDMEVRDAAIAVYKRDFQASGCKVVPMRCKQTKLKKGEQ